MDNGSLAFDRHEAMRCGKLDYSMSESAKAYYRSAANDVANAAQDVENAIRDAFREWEEAIAKAVKEAKRGDWFEFVYAKKANGASRHAKTEYYRVVVRDGQNRLKAAKCKPKGKEIARSFSFTAIALGGDVGLLGEDA